MKKEKTNTPYKYFGSFIIALIVLLSLNVISSRVYTRFDLTAEKRYTFLPQLRISIEESR